MSETIKYGDYVQMDDRFESVHIWSKELEEKNAGKWNPLKITKEEYDKALAIKSRALAPSKEERRQMLFNYFSSEHDIMLMEDDFRAIEEAFNPTVYPYSLTEKKEK